MLEYHKGHEEEILAILGQEFGHWQKMHAFKSIPIDILYMCIFAQCATTVMNDDSLLTEFGFTQQSYVMSLFLFIQIWMCSFNFIF